MHNFKKLISPVILMIIIVCVNEMLCFAAKPYSFFRFDMHNLENGEEYTDIFVGTSHGKAAVVPEVVDQYTGGNSINMCLGGEYLSDSYFIIKEAIRVGHPKRVIYELDPGYWVTEKSKGAENREMNDEFPKSLVKAEYYHQLLWGQDWRMTIFPWYLCRTGLKNPIERIKTKLGEEYKNCEDSFWNSDVQNYGGKGHVSIHRTDAVKTEENLKLWDRKEILPEVEEYFEKLKKLCEENDIELVVITTPIPQETLEKYQDSFEDANAYFTEYMAKQGIPYYNYNYINTGSLDKSLNGFSDYEGHMYEDEAEIFSTELGKMLAGK